MMMEEFDGDHNVVVVGVVECLLGNNNGTCQIPEEEEVDEERRKV